MNNRNTCSWLLLCLMLLIGGCERGCRKAEESITLDGSSTVYLISEAIAEEYRKQEPGRVTIGVSGTGGGFKKLCEGRIAIIGASRPITQTEVQLCKHHGINPQAFEVAYDGIVIVTSKKNTWAESLNTAELKKIFEPAAENTIKTWQDVRPEWPKEKLMLFAPGVSSGTYDHFTKVIVGVEHASRGDMTTSEDDNVLVHGVMSNPNSLGFFSYAYYIENKEKLKLLSVANGNNPPVLPTDETIRDHSYAPLSRPIFLYVNLKLLSEPAKKFVRFYLQQAAFIVKDVGFVPLETKFQKSILERFEKDLSS